MPFKTGLMDKNPMYVSVIWVQYKTGAKAGPINTFRYSDMIDEPIPYTLVIDDKKHPRVTQS